MEKIQLCSPEDLKDRWFPAECEACGFQGSSGLWEGGHALADTGDYSDPLCPKCGATSCEDVDNDQYPQDPRPYDTIVAMRKQFEALNDQMIDLYVNSLEK